MSCCPTLDKQPEDLAVALCQPPKGQLWSKHNLLIVSMSFYMEATFFFSYLFQKYQIFNI